jgi:lipoprotein-releasing system ATP-binding protein
MRFCEVVLNAVPVDASAPGAPVLEIEGMTYAIDRRVLFNSVDLKLSPGESVAVTGPSGSGKSTLLSCILGLVRPDSGAVRVAGEDVRALRGRRLARHRQENVGVVFQFGELLPELTPLDNVALAALLHRAGRRTAYERAAALLDELGVPRTGPTDRLSGGERQRTAVARALVNGPALLLADEPTGALDRATRDHVVDLLFSLPARRGCGLLVVTHDPAVAARADRVVDLNDGTLTEVDQLVGGAS